MNILAQTAVVAPPAPPAELAEVAAQHLGWLSLAAVAIIAIVFGIVTSAMKAGAFERSRREIAAYVAEGSISPEDADRLIGHRPPGGACPAVAVKA